MIEALTKSYICTSDKICINNEKKIVIYATKIVMYVMNMQCSDCPQFLVVYPTLPQIKPLHNNVFYNITRIQQKVKPPNITSTNISQLQVQTNYEKLSVNTKLSLKKKTLHMVKSTLNVCEKQQKY